MKYLLSLIVLLSIGNFVWAKDLGVLGNSFAITEQDILHYIQRKLHRMQREGIIAKKNQQLKDRAISYSYVVTTHCSQGMTCDRTVGYFDANDKMLTTERNFTVMVSRAKDGCFFATTDIDKLQKTITAKREERTAIEAHRDGINKDLSDKRTMAEIVKQGNTVAHLDRETVGQTTEKNTGDIPTKQKSHSKNVEMEI